jgi:hypothetical protein
MKQIRERLTYANVMSSIAVFLVLGGAAFAATQLPKNSVGSKQLKKGAVSSSKVKDGSLKAADFGAGQIPAGPAGPQGKEGKEGKEGKQGKEGKEGPPGLSELETVSKTSANNSDSRKTVFVECPPGKKVTGTAFDIDGASAGLEPNETKEATIDEIDLASDLSGAEFQAYEQKGGTASSWDLSGEIICAKVG